MAEFKLSDVGEGLTEAEIVTWKVKDGDSVAIIQVLVEIETAKSLVELPSPFAGVVQQLMVSAGETVPVGTPIIAIGDALEGPVPTAPAETSGTPQTESDPYLGMAEKAGAAEQARELLSSDIDLSNPAGSGSAEGESLVARMKPDRGATRRARKPAAAFQTQAAFEPTGATPPIDLDEEGESDGPAVRATSAAPAEPGNVRVLAKPPVRKLAKHLGVDLSALAGTGPNGVVTREDVEAAGGGAGGPETGAERLPRPGAKAEGGWREPIKGVRKMMSQAMVSSAFSAPHVTEWVTVDATCTM